MFVRALVAALLATPLLLSTTAHAWWGGPAHGFYGAGPVHSDVDGGFSFSTSFRGRGRGSGIHRYHAFSGYHPWPPVQPLQQSWTISGVNFKYDSAELTPASMEILDNVAEVVRNRPAQPLEVGGHASAEGDGPYNMDLSNRRAQTVRAYLVERGIDPNLLTYRGYGETRPLVENFTETGRRLNRRVELIPAFHARR